MKFRRSTHARETSALVVALALATSAQATFDGFIQNGDATNFPDESNGRTTGTPTVLAYRLAPGETVELDGRLDDACWSNAKAACGFSIWDPDRGAESTQETMFKVAYGPDAIYFAVACHEKDASDISKSLSRRDEFNTTDYVSIFIDPFHDRTTGYNFRTNPLGVQQDRYVYNDGDTDRSWNSVWKVETSQDADGWYAEFAIPYSAIRYRSGTWGMQVRRFMQTRGEDASWTTWDRDTPGFVSRFGTVTGLDDLPNPRQLELLPYGVYSQTDAAQTGPEELDYFSNYGLDLKYGLSTAYTLNATFQPDFGQVESDPADFNLSPFETFFEEKRPFFVEGSRFFQSPDFNLFYSRRIGTGTESARIRYAGKVTGKSAGGTSIGLLAAATDITTEDQNHNFLKNGQERSQYYAGRVSQEISEGRHRFGLTGTAVHHDDLNRSAFTGGADFRFQLFDRALRFEGTAVGSAVKAGLTGSDPEAPHSYGSGGELSLSRRGKISIGTWARWESDKLELNDMGFLGAPDEMGTGAWGSFEITPDGDDALFNIANLNLNYWQDYLYAARQGMDIHTGEDVWAYDRGHPSSEGGNANGWMQFKDYTEFWWGLALNLEGRQRFDTRDSYRTLARDDAGNPLDYHAGSASIPGGGPLIIEPETYGSWFGFSSDTRKRIIGSFSGNLWWDVARNYSMSGDVSVDWTMSSAMRLEVSGGYNRRVDDTQHLTNFENPGKGIGGVSYVYGKIDQETVDVTLRGNLLFGRNTSFELYAQPFVAVGSYTNTRELNTPDTYDLVPFSDFGFNASDRDFRFASANLNAVFRWEYRPGSTLFLVWTHARSDFVRRDLADDPRAFDNRLSTDTVFENEPENVLLMKVTYWLPI